MRNNGPLLHSPLAISHMTQALADLLIRTVLHRFSHLLEKRAFSIVPWHVRDAIDFMHANIEKPIRVAVVAEAVRVSVRGLENGFRTFKETTPQPISERCGCAPFEATCWTLRTGSP